jgi:hypothetical protein
MGEILNMVQIESASQGADAQALLDDVTRGHHAALVVALAQQTKIAKAIAEGGEVFARGGLGVRTMCVHTDIYWDMVRLYGPDCWRDKGFRKDMLRDIPALQVRAESRKTMLRMPGLTSAGARTERRVA